MTIYMNIQITYNFFLNKIGISCIVHVCACVRACVRACVCCRNWSLQFHLVMMVVVDEVVVVIVVVVVIIIIVITKICLNITVCTSSCRRWPRLLTWTDGAMHKWSKRSSICRIRTILPQAATYCVSWRSSCRASRSSARTPSSASTSCFKQ